MFWLEAYLVAIWLSEAKGFKEPIVSVNEILKRMGRSAMNIIFRHGPLTSEYSSSTELALELRRQQS
jgi:hypothetical protein